jgi:hypothetical protein
LDNLTDRFYCGTLVHPWGFGVYKEGLNRSDGYVCGLGAVLEPLLKWSERFAACLG